MSNVDVQGESRGDIMRRLHRIERQIQELQAGRRLEAAHVGEGGLRIRGGLLRVQDTVGDDMFRAGGDPGEVFIRQDLLSPLAVAIFADRADAQTVDVSEFIDTDTYDDIATVGPVIQDIEVLTGKMIVAPSASIGVAANASNLFSAEAYMSYEISGPTIVPPSDERAARATLITTDQGMQIIVRTGGTFVHRDLEPGVYQVRAKYRTAIGDENHATANDRTLTVIAF